MLETATENWHRAGNYSRYLYELISGDKEFYWRKWWDYLYVIKCAKDDGMGAYKGAKNSLPP